jgi:hypothetical protein
MSRESNADVPNAGAGLKTLPEKEKWNRAFETYLRELDAKKPARFHFSFSGRVLRPAPAFGTSVAESNVCLRQPAALVRGPERCGGTDRCVLLSRHSHLSRPETDCGGKVFPPDVDQALVAGSLFRI